MFLNFIIFGTRGINSTKAKGEMYCPSCGPKQPYKHVSVRRFFTLYFIPLIPLDRLGEYIQCGTCKGQFNLEILNYDPEKAQQDFEVAFFEAVIHVLCLVALADGSVDDDEVLAIKEVYERLSKQPTNEDQIRQLIQNSENQSRPINLMMADLRGNLNDAGKETFIEEALRVAAADGNIDKSELRVIEEVATALEMSPAHQRGVIEEIKSKLGVK